ncbi:glycosyltransferase [Amycolatopsis sp. PS_44_ISF1]|uniref:glycosyltransferase n=1 Tax=Amycolatopsis sp. PS_44_ISF1 TaxID=2974917 RepID=UPI0028DD7235|nr:glycosyltransferase [Amycolatopsis sp. PS_44_ISF1]MDT8913013.1 glycosyl transferase [Amycolatopsis sp. PS_44_ISF1]
MIAYYVHHHGSGHLRRAAAIAAHLGEQLLGLSSLPRPSGWPGRWTTLPDDAGGADAQRDDVTAGATLHWVPRHHAGLRDRMALVSAELRRYPVRLLVADVSVEIALLARLHGVPVVVVAQPGRRTDRAHRTAYDLAEAILAPWPARPAPGWPPRWLSKTVHTGAFSRFDGRTPAPAAAARRVLVLWGAGGLAVSTAQLHAAATATPAWQWDIAGPLRPGEDPGSRPANLHHHGWVADPWPLLAGAEVVVTHAGQNALAEVAAARRPAVVIPQPRPFGEQSATAAALNRASLGVVRRSWPAPARWSGVLAEASSRGGDWRSWSPGDGAGRAAAALRELAGPR